MASTVRDEDSARPAQQARQFRRALASLSLATLLASLGTSSAGVALPALMQAFDASVQAVQWVVLAYLLAVTTLIVGAGRLADMLGRRPLLLGGIALFIASSALCGLAPTLGLLVAARALQGLGAAAMMALALAFVAETVPKERTGSAMGLIGAMSSIGTSLGPSLGGVLIAAAGWRAIFLVNIPLGLLALALAWRSLPARREAPCVEAGGFDAIGTALLALSLAAYALAMTLGRGGFGLPNLALLAAAGLGAGLFALVEARVDSPLIRPALVRDPGLGAGLAMSLLVATVMMATLVVAPFYLTRALGLDAARAGLVLSSGPLVVTLAALPAGRLVDRFGAHRVTAAGLSALAFGSSALSLARVDFGIPGYVGPIAVIAIGYALFQTANNAATMSGVGDGQRGVVSGLLNLSRNLGLITGAAVMGAVFAFAAAGPGGAGMAALSPDSVVNGMQATFRVATVLGLVALIIAMASRRVLVRQMDR